MMKENKKGKHVNSLVSSLSVSQQPLHISSFKSKVNNCFRKAKHSCTKFKSISKELKQISKKEAIKTISSKICLMSVESKLLKCDSIFLTSKSSQAETKMTTAAANDNVLKPKENKQLDTLFSFIMNTITTTIKTTSKPNIATNQAQTKSSTVYVRIRNSTISKKNPIKQRSRKIASYVFPSQHVNPLKISIMKSRIK